MGRYLTDAKHHMNRIRHYYDHAGAAGHEQAQHHYHELGGCYKKSAGKNQHAGDAPVIKGMCDEAGKLMAEMKNREQDLPGHEG